MSNALRLLAAFCALASASNVGAEAQAQHPAAIETSCAVAISVAVSDHVAGDVAAYAATMKGGWGHTACLPQGSVYLVRFPVMKQPTSGGHVEYSISSDDFSIIEKRELR